MASWLEQVDPGGHRRIRRIKGRRLGSTVPTSCRAASALPTLLQASHFWASVSENQATRWSSARDFTFLNTAGSWAH